MISTAFAIQAISIPAYVSLDICYVSGCVTYLQDVVFARLLSCGDVERKTEVLTVSSLHLSIDEVRTHIYTNLPGGTEKVCSYLLIISPQPV